MKKKLIQELEKRLPGYEIKTMMVTKANQAYEALAIKPTGMNVTMSFHFADVLEDYQNNGDAFLDKFVGIVKKQERKISDFPFPTYDKCRDKLFLSVISAEKNAKYLAEAPCRYMADLAVAVRCPVKIGNEGYSSFLVKNDLLQCWNITGRQLFKDAMKNMQKEMTVISLADILNLPEYMQKAIGGLQCLTTRNRTYGAGLIACDGVLESMAGHMGGSYYIIPSSIHEVLLIPEYMNDRVAIEEMVSHINREFVDEEEILSDTLYHYDAKEKVFETAEEYEKRKDYDRE